MQCTAEQRQTAREAARADGHDPDEVVATAEADRGGGHVEGPIWYSCLRRGDA